MKPFTYILSIFMFTNHVSSQTVRDSINFISYESKFMIRSNLYTNRENYFYSFNNEGINIATNNKIYTSISFDYEIISVAVSFASKIFSRNSKDYLMGKSSFSQISFSAFPKNFIQTVSYKKNKGFYLVNTQDFELDWKEGDPYVKLPNLEIQEYSGSTSYVFNKNFSVKSIYYQSEWQKKSSGSLITSLDYNYTVTRDKIEERIDREGLFNFGINIGYHYNWIVSKNINISPHASFGLGGKSDINELYLEKRIGGGLFIGYNSDKFLFGSKINLSSSNYKINSGDAIGNDILYGLLYIGFRFNPPKVVSKNYKSLQKKIPFM